MIIYNLEAQWLQKWMHLSMGSFTAFTWNGTIYHSKSERLRTSTFLSSFSRSIFGSSSFQSRTELVQVNTEQCINQSAEKYTCSYLFNLFVCIYVHIYAYLCACLHASVYTHTYVHLWMWLCLRACVRGIICAYVYAYFQSTLSFFYKYCV